MKAYVFLFLAILCEVAASSTATRTDGFTRLFPSLVSGGLYLAALVFFAQTLKTIPLGVGYAIWSGAGITLVALSSVFILKQKLDLPAIIGLTMIVGGGVLIQGFSKSISH